MMEDFIGYVTESEISGQISCDIDLIVEFYIFVGFYTFMYVCICMFEFILKDHFQYE